MVDFDGNDDLRRLGVRVLAASVDTAEQQAKLVSELGLTNLEMYYGVDGLATADALDAYYDASGNPYLQPTAFVLNPSGAVVQALYSSNVLGRLSAADVAAMVSYMTG